jgi:hypothetical protein
VIAALAGWYLLVGGYWLLLLGLSRWLPHLRHY